MSRNSKNARLTQQAKERPRANAKLGKKRPKGPASTVKKNTKKNTWWTKKDGPAKAAKAIADAVKANAEDQEAE